jgi:SecD/SecF fusion protein
MSKPLRWKIVLLLALVLFSGATLLPSFFGADKDDPAYQNSSDWWKKYRDTTGLRLGLDLQGGMHLILKVDLDKAVENTLDFDAQNLKEVLLEKQITLIRTESGDPHKILFVLPNTSALDTVKTIIKDDFSEDLNFTEIETEAGSFPKFSLTLNADKTARIKKNAVNESLEIIRNRIDQFGVSEPVIVKQGKDEIVVQLPGIKDPDRALDLIGQTAQLEFKLVADTPGLNLAELIRQAEDSGQWKMKDGRKKLNIALQQRLPVGTEIYFRKDVDKDTGAELKIPTLLNSPILMTGEMVKDAQVRVGGTFNEPYVSLDLTGRGGKVFGQLTSKNVGKQLAIVLDDVVRSAPVIREKILGGSAQISGSFTYEEANDLAIILRVGALPAPVSIVQNLTVGASLGHDTINQGLMSGLFGAALVLLFMIFYYRTSGVIANFALLLNLLFLFAGLASLQATLTLPGIAGIILSIGMAVDSNILIFERMREEFALGKSLKSGIDGGYGNAFSTIVDSQVTTLITALALFLFGTGPIKGFAVTLSLGVSFNLFTTLFGTRLVYDILYNKHLLKQLTFFQFIKKTNLDYMKIRNITFSASGFFVLLGLIAFGLILDGKANLGIDFTGGSMLQYKAAESFQLDQVRTALNKSELEGIEPQVASDNRLIIKLKSSEATVGHVSEQVSTLLKDNLPEKQFVLESQSEIGSSVSEVLRNKALLAIFISLAGVIFYLALRFDFRFGVAAAAATLHDVIVVLGICWILNIEINLLIVTALLTIAGYSLNDSVIIFDRIRENLKKAGSEKNFLGIINQSTNEVLGRTIATALTTALVLVPLFFLGGLAIHEFSFVLLTGIVVGTYSSIFIASPILYFWRRE